MLQREFEERVGFVVATEEFETICQFYNSVECDKDEFCKMWMTMNPQRVKEEKARSKQAKELQDMREKLFRIWEKIATLTYEQTQDFACGYFTKRQEDTLLYFGITIDEWARISDVRYYIVSALKINAGF